MDPIIGLIREDLEANADAATKESFSRFFKEEVRGYGVKTAVVAKIAEKYWKHIRARGKGEIFDLCEELYRSGMIEEAFVVSGWVPHLKERFEPGDFAVFEDWIDRYVSNWAMCDGFCNHTMGDFIVRYPGYIVQLKRWTQSKNRWMRRASAVSLIIPAKRGHFLKDVLEIADLLLTDGDDLVRKGYGWLLKEASRKHEDDVFSYVMKNRRDMPRTALRYAIELMPKERRQEAMKKDW